jgi:hypothetical protein
MKQHESALAARTYFDHYADLWADGSGGADRSLLLDP